MWGFRVELLHAEALPLHLLDPLKAAFEGSDPLVRKAAESHREQLRKHLEFVRSLDYSALAAEWDYWIEVFRNRFRNRRLLDPKTYLSLAHQLECFQEAYILLNARFFSLIALGLFASGFSRDEAVSFLAGQSWATKHEVLTRWGWIKRHNELLRDGRVKLSAPYFCSLSPRGTTFEQNDEEFYQLLYFLHLLRFATGRELLFFEKWQTPDFKLEDEAGCIIGAEMTEVWVSSAWTKEFVASTQVADFLNERLRHLGLDIRIEKPPSWRSFGRRKAEIAEWILDQAVADIPAKGLTLRNEELKLKVRLSPAEGPPRLSYGSFASSGPKAFDTDKQSQAMYASLQERLLHKIETPVPTVKPCYLVIKPIHDLDTDPEKVVTEFFRHPAPDVSSHFSEVWLASEKQAVRLV